MKLALAASAPNPGTERSEFAARRASIRVFSWKSTALKRGVLQSACWNAPPTAFGRWFTSPSSVPAFGEPLGFVGLVRKTRGSPNGSGPIQPRTAYLISSFPCSGSGRSVWSRPGYAFGPASRTRTVFPAAVSTCAADPPPAPLPMMQ